MIYEEACKFLQDVADCNFDNFEVLGKAIHVVLSNSVPREEADAMRDKTVLAMRGYPKREHLDDLDDNNMSGRRPVQGPFITALTIAECREVYASIDAYDAASGAAKEQHDEV